MTTPINDGGPAFPFPFPDGPEPVGNEFHDRCEGMTLRDYFAAASINGMMSNPESFQAMVRLSLGEMASAAKWAESAYNIADAMIEQRNK